MRSAPGRLLSAALMLGVFCVVAGTARAAPPSPVGWSPTALDTNVSDAVARDYYKAFAVRRAETGYLYALPAFVHFKQRYEWVRSFTAFMGDLGNPFGQFLLLRTPTTPQTKDVLPNHDTLYGATFVDLGVSPVVLSVPDVPGRYYSLALLDAWFYNFAYVGSRTTGQKAGNYLIVGPGWTGKPPTGVSQVIHAPTNSINVYQRIYFRDSADVAAVRALQDRIRILPLAKYLDSNAHVPLPDPQAVLAVDPVAVSDPVRMLSMANGYMGENPPPVEDRALIDYFAPVGIGPGLSVPVDADGEDTLRQGAALAGNTVTALALVGARVENGWQIPPTDVARRGGPGGIALQAMLQLRSIGLNVPEEAVYYNAYTDGAGQPLRAGTRYTITFAPGQIPPVLRDRFGFWSVTMYHRSTYRLVDNPAGRYVVRSGDPLKFDADGSLTLLVQSDPPMDPALSANWLPAPESGEFVLTLRVYLGEPDVVQGRYVPPAAVARP